MLCVTFPVLASAMPEAYLEWITPASPMIDPRIAPAMGKKGAGVAGAEARPSAKHPGLLRVTDTAVAATPAKMEELRSANAKA